MFYLYEKPNKFILGNLNKTLQIDLLFLHLLQMLWPILWKNIIFKTFNIMDWYFSISKNYLPTRFFNSLDKRMKFFNVSSGDTSSVAFLCKTPGNSSSSSIASTYNNHSTTIIDISRCTHPIPWNHL